MSSGNYYISRKLKELQINENYRLHKMITSAKPVIQRNQSSMVRHVLNHSKRKQIREDKFTEIERENRILLEKIHGIMRKQPKSYRTGLKKFDVRSRSYDQRTVLSKYSDQEEKFNDIKPRKKPRMITASQNYLKEVMKDTINLNNRLFLVKIFQHLDKVEITAEDSKDFFLLKLSFFEALNVMNGQIN